jgi:ComF family protein
MPPVLEALVRFLYPGACPACREPSEDDALCPRCAREVPGARGFPLPEALAGRPALAACRYAGVVRELVLRLKFERDPHPARALGSLLADAALREGFARDADCVVPMPLSGRRLRQRGFNQAEAVAAAVAARLGAPLLRLLLRPVHRPPQADLGPSRRALNVRGVFRARDGAFARAALLVDDVVTTGHTMAEAAAALEAAGARRVLCGAVALSAR